jgi:hypothetical protein
VRTALRENSARYYLDYYHVERGFRATADLTRALALPESREAAEEAICRAAADEPSVFLVVVDQAGDRRALWEITESLFAGTNPRLNRPAIVLKQAELPSIAVLPAPSTAISLCREENL